MIDLNPTGKSLKLQYAGLKIMLVIVKAVLAQVDVIYYLCSHIFEKKIKLLKISQILKSLKLHSVVLAWRWVDNLFSTRNTSDIN